ncbi:UvrD-helicase domain-containing protein [Arthrobacter sp. JUb115]|uniref:UvrD-helicase domain-containing protein n=1 Tax=Arthrobacter sp. JUb115 TaxID=2485108 RepID=UPI001061544D|nr:UvrD-helicase domain-containing protein [Arthrobacter sp. JUb115]TDU29313.1 UvrD-like helicase family protein [Arthrobacter sp. JUb115]
MDSELSDTGRRLLAAAPASVEMPAGAGKTHLLAAAVAIAAENGQRSLVLTHTNAGVDAIRKRLQKFGVSSRMARVDTITSWAFSLVGAYPHLAGLSVSDIPNWIESDRYVEGATRVAGAIAVQEVHAVSFDFVFVDEYQDCTLLHHAFVRAIAGAVPRTVVLGDRLQAIFGFAGELVDWAVHVSKEFPAFEISHKPHRWKGHNEHLGAWLLGIRPMLVAGQAFDFAEHNVPGVSVVVDNSPTSIASVAFSFTNYGETVVLLDKWPNSVAGHASRLGGSYSVMEDISGNFMRTQINGDDSKGILGLPSQGDPTLARWFAQFAKACVIGLADINQPILRRLDRNQSLHGLARAGVQPVVDALELLRQNPTYEQLAEAAQTVRAQTPLKIYRWEVWKDTLESIALTVMDESPVIDNLGRVRERLRRQGRQPHSRIASRTLLVKGLEYDHVIIADLAQMRDPRNLYVALSRARKSVTVVGSSPRVLLRND